MTPTLLGRWQQRLFLLPTIGLLLSFPYAVLQKNWYYLAILIYMGVFGCLWDLLYQQLQRLRWDNDWPYIFQLAGSVAEGLLLLILLKNNVLLGINADKLAGGWLFFHYWMVSTGMFGATHSLLPILFPHARYRGHQWH